MLALTILGNNSAIPAYDRNPTAQILQTSSECFLIDCGEGTQMQMSKFKIKRSLITKIFISHLHGDHYYGLIGLLTTMSLLGRKTDLHLYAPAPLINIINIQLIAGESTLSFQLHFHPLINEGIIADEKMQISCFKTNHKIECWGFIFRQKKILRKIDLPRANIYEIPTAYYDKLQQGFDYITKKGTIVPNEEVTVAGPKSKSYAFCADTIYDETLIEKIKNVDLLYHEATYLNDLAAIAADRFHSTSSQAATIALKGNVSKLLIGHFSTRYNNLDPFILEAKNIFLHTELALQGVSYKI